MNKIIGLVVTSALIVTGCQADKAQVNEVEYETRPAKVVEKREPTEAEKIMEDFNRLLAKEPREDEVYDFIKSKIKKVPKEYADELVIGYERVQNSTYRNRHQFMMKDEVQAICINNFKLGGVPEDLSTVKDVGLRIYIDDLKKTGYKLVVKDGKYLPEIDYTFYDGFKPYISEEMITYLDLMEFRKELLFDADQRLPITWDEVFDRIIKFESFLRRFPDSQKKDTVWLNYEYYTKLYLYGTEGTPAFNHSNNELDDWLKVSYSNIYLGNTGSEFIKYFRDYLQVMDSEEYVLTEVVDSERNTVLYNLDMQLIY